MVGRFDLLPSGGVDLVHGEEAETLQQVEHMDQNREVSSPILLSSSTVEGQSTR